MDIENYCQDYCLETIFPKHYFKDLQVITLTAGQSVCKQGEQLEYLHYIVKGRFKIVRRLFNGKEHILDIKTKPTLIGDIELLTNRQIVSSVIALEDLTVIQLSLKGRKEKLLTDATFLLKLSQELAQAFHDQNIKASTNLGYTVKELLASHILAIEEQGCFHLELSSLADSFGVSYRHLLRVIHDMVKEGLIQKEKPKYFIKNRFALESLNIQP
ncbi:cyclic nucleotide-binding domain-containing protein [Streptococcus agalactiae]|nr:cyclic nucleotide-binding domain-containing protein [Streptococcus agalactiae]